MSYRCIAWNEENQVGGGKKTKTNIIRRRESNASVLNDILIIRAKQSFKRYRRNKSRNFQFNEKSETEEIYLYQASSLFRRLAIGDS